MDDDKWALLEELWPLLDVGILSFMKYQSTYHFTAFSICHEGSF